MRPLILAAIAPLALAPLILAPVRSDAGAQIMASERGTVSQVVDGTRTTVDYHRPRARGRTALFGTLVKWGETWTPGANQATTLAVTKDVTIGGTPVPRGKYSVWFVTARGDWELVLDPDTTRFHTQRPRARPGQVRLTVRPEKRPFVEVLTWSFPEVSATGTTLAMQWDTVYVPLRITVAPTHHAAVGGDAAARVVGRYRMRPQRPPAPAGPRDTTLDEQELPPDSMTFTIRHEKGELRAVMDPPLFASESGYTDWVLLPKAGDLYVLGRFDRGELVEVMDSFALQFDVVDGRAVRFEVRAPNDALIASGSRLP